MIQANRIDRITVKQRFSKGEELMCIYMGDAYHYHQEYDAAAVIPDEQLEHGLWFTVRI